jgi:glycosyltransferase involved in cell wall biosynthesis
MHISVVTPVYNFDKGLPHLYRRLENSLSSLSDDYEIIMVNDGSPDNSWDIILELSAHNPKVKGINLSRNFGQHFAITAGLDYAKGDYIVVMDCDLQHRPEDIPKLYNKAKEGYDVVIGLRQNRKDGSFREIISELYYKVFNYLTENEINYNISSFGLYARKVINSVKEMREQNRSFILFVLWSGFKKIYVEVEHGERIVGESSYNLSKMIQLALDSIIAHSNKPLKLAVKFGFLVSFISVLFATWFLLRYCFYSIAVEGWTSIMVSIYFTTGLIVGSMGLIGLYINKIFNEVKRRPLYIIESTTFKIN